MPESVTLQSRRTLAGYVDELIVRLRDGAPHDFERLRAIAGRLRARITLDDETAEAVFVGASLRVTTSLSPHVDGEGVTDRQTCMALLDGQLEATDALLDGRIELRASWPHVDRFLHIVEILLGAGVRVPSIRMLADEFRSDARNVARHKAVASSRRSPFGAWELSDSEETLLRRLDLLG
jgi:hypothetical protein